MGCIISPKRIDLFTKSKRMTDVGGYLEALTNDLFRNRRFIWFSFIVIGLLVTLVIISSLWEKFQTSPTITGLDTDFHKWDIPFPAITLCPQNPVDPQLVREYVFE